MGIPRITSYFPLPRILVQANLALDWHDQSRSGLIPARLGNSLEPPTHDLSKPVIHNFPSC